MAAGTKLTKSMCPTTPDAISEMKDTPYREAVGVLLYISLSTRPDISNAVTTVSRFNNNPGPQHWKAIKRILRYLQGTKSLGITFTRPDPLEAPIIIGFADADYAGDSDTRRSTTGYVFKLANGPVSWTSKLQQSVALSTSEAEYMSAGAATQEALWLRSLLSELGYHQRDPTVLLEDNQGCIAMSLNSGNHKRTKHIDVRHHFIRDQVHANNIILKYLPTDKMTADILTKPLQPCKFKCLRSAILGDTVLPLSGSVEVQQ